MAEAGVIGPWVDEVGQAKLAYGNLGSRGGRSTGKLADLNGNKPVDWVVNDFVLAAQIAAFWLKGKNSKG